MFSPLSRGYGSWTGELYDPYKPDIDKDSLPSLDPGEVAHRHGITVGLSSRATTTMSMRSAKEQPITCTLTPRSDGKLNIPKTFSTRKGALMLFSSPDDEENANGSRSSSRQRSAMSRKLKTAAEMCYKLGTLDRLSMSILQYGDQEDYDRENTSIADEKNKMVLNFIHSLDESEIDRRVQPGSDLSSYLRDLKYRSSARHGSTYLPQSRETMELHALLQGLQDNKWPMSYSSPDGTLTERSNTNAEQFTTSRGSTRPGSPASGTTSPKSILSARKLTASIKSLGTYRQSSTVVDNESDVEPPTYQTHPTISAKVTRRSPTPDDPSRIGSGSPQRSRSQRQGPTSITGSIEEEASDFNQAGGWHVNTVGSYLVGSYDVNSEMIRVNIPTDPDKEREDHSIGYQGEGHSLGYQGEGHSLGYQGEGLGYEGEGHTEDKEGDGSDGAGLEHMSEASDGSDLEMLYTAGDSCDGRVEKVDGGGVVSVASPSQHKQHDQSSLPWQHDSSSPPPGKSVPCDPHVVTGSESIHQVHDSAVADPGVDRSLSEEMGDVGSSITEDSTEPIPIKVNISNLITGPIAEEDGAMVTSDLQRSEVKWSPDRDGMEGVDVVNIPTGTDPELPSNVNDDFEQMRESSKASQDKGKVTMSPVQRSGSGGSRSSPRVVITPTTGDVSSRESPAKRGSSGRKSPKRGATPVKHGSRQSSGKKSGDRSLSPHSKEARDTLDTVARQPSPEPGQTVDLEDVESVASSVLIEQDIVLPSQDDSGDGTFGETGSVSVNGAAQPLLPQYTGSMGDEGYIIQDNVPPSPQALTQKSSRPSSRASQISASRASPRSNSRSSPKSTSRVSPIPTSKSTPKPASRDSPIPALKSSPRSASRGSPTSASKSSPHESPSGIIPVPASTSSPVPASASSPIPASIPDSLPASHKVDKHPQTKDQHVAQSPQSAKQAEEKARDMGSLAVGSSKAQEEVKKGQQRRGQLPRGKKAKKDVTKAIGISSVQADSPEEKPKEHEITVYKTAKIAAPKEEAVIPDFIAEEAARREEVSKEALEQQMQEMSQIVDNTLAGTVLEEDDEGGLTAEELALAAKKVKERMAAAKEKIEGVEKPQTLVKPPPVKQQKPVKGTTKKGGKQPVEKKEVDEEKEKLKELRRLQKEQRLQEAKELQEKIEKQKALRLQKEKEARDRGKLTTDNVELELEMERLEREADEIQLAEDDVRQALGEARKKQREEREIRRKADMERKKQLALDRREQEKKILEKARSKEMEMLEKIEDANVRKRQREEEELKEEEEERLAQERLEEEMRDAQRQAEEDEDRLRELERQAEEEAMQRLIDEREEATRKRRLIETEKHRIEEEEEKKRQIIIEEERKLDEERRKRADEEYHKVEEEKKRLAELQRIESEAREQMQTELAHRREKALARRERNLEARSNMTRLRHAQGITQPWVWSYFIQWPMETYNIPIGGEPDDKKKKRPKGIAGRR